MAAEPLNDFVDLHVSDASTAVTRSIGLVNDGTTQYTPESAFQAHDGSYNDWERDTLDRIAGDLHRKNGVSTDGDDDASLQIRMGDTVPSFFLDNLNRKGLPPVTGTCYGSSSCLPP